MGFNEYGENVRLFNKMDAGVTDCDVIIALRIQNERIDSPALASQSEFYKMYGLNKERLALAKPDCIVMHPGPMNRGVEIDSSIADGDQSVILKNRSPMDCSSYGCIGTCKCKDNYRNRV